jgi:hypothetical protein
MIARAVIGVWKPAKIRQDHGHQPYIVMDDRT